MSSPALPTTTTSTLARSDPLLLVRSDPPARGASGRASTAFSFRCRLLAATLARGQRGHPESVLPSNPGSFLPSA
jgi:hypothetical protein